MDERNRLRESRDRCAACLTRSERAMAEDMLRKIQDATVSLHPNLTVGNGYRYSGSRRQERIEQARVLKKLLALDDEARAETQEALGRFTA